MTKQLRQQKHLSQEQLAERTGLSLRTIQRIESGERVGNTSLLTLAEFFEVSANRLEREAYGMPTEPEPGLTLKPDPLNRHRAVQLLIFVVTFFVFVFQWLGYYGSFNLVPSNPSLWTILWYLTQIAIVAAILAYLFSLARVSFYWSYYAAVAAFVLTGIGLGFWTTPAGSEPSLLFPVFYTLMLLSLSLFHVLQLALSLQSESTVVIQRVNWPRGDMVRQAGLGD